MLSYQFYKVLHLVSIFVFLTGSSILLMSEKHRIMFWKILTGVSGFFILVAGMGLLARLGLQHGQGFPSWVWAKIVIWFFLLGIGHMVAKRLPQHGAKAYALSLVLASLAAYLAINKI